MPRSFVSLDIGSTAVRAAQATVDRLGRVRVTKLAARPLPRGVMKPGAVLDPDALTSVLKELWDEEKLSSRYVLTAVSDPEVRTQTAFMDWLPDREFATAFPLSRLVTEFVPAEWVDPIVTYATLAEEDTAEGPRREIQIVASPRQFTDDLMGAMKAAGLRPIHIDYTPLVLTRLAGDVASMENDEATPAPLEAVFHVGAETCFVTVHRAGTPLLIRTIRSRGGRHIDDQINKRLEWLVKETGLTAEDLKKGYGIVDVETPNGEAHPLTLTISEEVNQLLNDLAMSISTAMQSAGGRVPFSKVVLSGGTTQLKGLKKRMESELRTQVAYASLSDTFDLAEDLSLPDGYVHESQFAVALGLFVGWEAI